MFDGGEEAHTQEDRRINCLCSARAWRFLPGTQRRVQGLPQHSMWQLTCSYLLIAPSSSPPIANALPASRSCSTSEKGSESGAVTGASTTRHHAMVYSLCPAMRALHYTVAASVGCYSARWQAPPTLPAHWEKHTSVACSRLGSICTLKPCSMPMTSAGVATCRSLTSPGIITMFGPCGAVCNMV